MKSHHYEEAGGIDSLNPFRTPAVRKGYINMPFYGSSSTNRNSQENEYQDVKDVKVPPPKPPRKNKGVKRIFSFKPDSKKSSMKSGIPQSSANVPVHKETALPPHEVSNKLEWNSNPIYSNIDSNDLDKVTPRVTYVNQNALMKNSGYKRPKSVDLLKDSTRIEQKQTRPCSVGGLDWKYFSKSPERYETPQFAKHEICSAAAVIPVKEEILACSKNAIENPTQEETVSSRCLSENINKCYRILAEVCEIEELNKQETVQSHMATQVEEDIEGLIDYCNTVSKTFGEMIDTQPDKR